MTKQTLTDFLDILRDSSLLDAEQWQEVRTTLSQNSSDPKQLARQLMDRNWLTPYQVNQLFRNQGKELVLGGYVLLERLGEGGMGKVFKARHKKLGRLVALKVIHPHRLDNPKAVLRFQREITAAAQLSHPNVVRAYDADEVDGYHFLTMEYVEGTDLTHLIKKSGPLPIADACRMIRSAAVGLQHAYENGLIHRDIKPSNLFLAKSTNNPNGVIKILDFGLALVDANYQEVSNTTLTQDGVLGTPDYIAPEQARNSHTVDIRADLYSLGGTFYFLLTGQPPFVGGTAMERLIRHWTEAAPPVTDSRPEVPAEVAAIVERLLAKEPGDRYQTPTELAPALDEIAPVIVRVDSTLPETMPTPVVEASSQDYDETQPFLAEEAPAAAVATTRRRAPLSNLTLLLIYTGITVVVLGGTALALYLMGPFSQETEPTADKKGSNQPPVKQVKLRPLPFPKNLSFFGPKPELLRIIGEQPLPFWAPVSHLTINATGNRLAAAEGKLVRILSTNTGKTIAILRHHPVAVNGLSFSPDGRYLLSSSEGETPREFKARIVVVSDADTGSKVVAFGGHFLNMVVSGHFSPDGKSVYCGSFRHIRKYSLNNPDEYNRLGRFTDWVRMGPVFANGDCIASATKDGTVQYLDDKGDVTRTYTGLEGNTVTEIIHDKSTGRILANYGREILLWDKSKEVPIGKITMPGEVDCLKLSPTGKFGLSCHDNGDICLWDISKQDLSKAFRAPGQRFSAAEFLPKDSHVVLVDKNQQLHRLALQSDAVPKPAKTVPVQDVSMSSDGRLVLTFPALQVWDWKANKKLADLSDHVIDADAAAFGPGAEQVLIMRKKGFLEVWDWRKGKRIKQSESPIGAAVRFAASPDGSIAVLTNDVGWAVTWNVETGAFSPIMNTDTEEIRVVRVSNTSTMVFGTDYGEIMIWPDDKRRPRRLHHKHKAAIIGLIRLKSGDLLSADEAGQILICDPNAKEITAQWTRGPSTLSDIALSPDGRWLIGVGEDGQFGLWDVKSGEVRIDGTFPGRVNGLGFAPDSTHFVTGNGNGTVYVFRLPV